MEYGIDPQKWYSPNEIVDQGLLFGKSKRYVFDVLRSGQLKATNTSQSQKPQWKILGQNLIEFINKIGSTTQHANSNATN